MSVTNVMNPIAIYNPVTSPLTQTNAGSIRSGIQQLGQDLQAGNLQAAQQDYVTLSQQGPLANQQTNNPLVQDLQAVGAALQGATWRARKRRSRRSNRRRSSKVRRCKRFTAITTTTAAGKTLEGSRTIRWRRRFNRWPRLFRAGT